MAKVIVHANRCLSLGSGPNAPKLKIGKNSIEESDYEIVKGSWFVKSLKASGTIVVEEVPEEPKGLAEVVIGPDKIEVVQDSPISEERVEPIKTGGKFKRTK